MTWHAQLQLNYRKEAQRTLLDFSHNGPLRILQSLYPESDAICHNVLVHPPGGVAGGDVLDIEVHVSDGAHALITTPGATRFYRSLGEPGVQRSTVKLGENARLEWLPLENIAYSGCIAENRLHVQLASTAQMIGWDITALGLPASQQPFERGEFTQHTELVASDKSLWLERGRMEASDERLLNSALGMNRFTCLTTMYFIAGSPINSAAAEVFLSQSREITISHSLAKTAGITQTHRQVIVLRALSHNTEEALDLCKRIRGVWRRAAWGLDDVSPRIWAM